MTLAVVTSSTQHNGHSNGIVREFTCPQCGRTRDGCYAIVSQTSTSVICMRVASGETTTGGGNRHRLTAEQAASFHNEPHHLPISGESHGRNDKLAKQSILFFRRGEAARAILAAQLDVPAESLRAFGVGFTYAFDKWDATGAYTAPEMNAAMEIVGLHVRKPNGEKFQAPGGRRGLVYAPDWHNGRECLIVEGLTDAAAAHAMGFSVIGRPSNTGGLDYLAEMLESIPSDRPILIVGENDRKSNGTWPGRDGAVRAAQVLAEQLHRPVVWCLPPAVVKDTRAWFNMQTDRNNIGERYLAALYATAVEVEPPKPIPVIEILRDEREAVELDQFREQMENARQELSPGTVYLDRSPTGTGKTHANLLLVQREAQKGNRSLLAFPTHNNGREACGELVHVMGVNAARYPQRVTAKTAAAAAANDKDCDPVNCEFDYADVAEMIGLHVMQTACVMCPVNQKCKSTGYLSLLKMANESEVSIATHARAATQSLTELAWGRSVVVIEEDPAPVLGPSASLEVDSIPSAVRLIDICLNDPAELDKFSVDDDVAKDEQKTAVFNWLSRAIPILESLPKSIDMATGLASIRPVGPIPKGVETHLWFAMLRQKMIVSGWRELLAALSGEASATIIVHEQWDAQSPTKKSVSRDVLTSWDNPIPSHAAAVICDATSTADGLRSSTGREVIDITPAGRIDLKHRATQCVHFDISRGTKPDKVTTILRGLLAEIPSRRVGVIHHQNHRLAVQTLAGESGAIVKASHFGSGDERSSNAWTVGDDCCEWLIVVGTPRPGADAVRAELVRRGEWAAAAIEQPEWRPYHWRGWDEFGNPCPSLIRTSGYADPHWQSAFVAICRATLVQAVGRGRGILDHGIPVIVVSREPIGLPIRDGGKPWLTPQHQKTLEAVLLLSQSAHPLTDNISNGIRTQTLRDISKSRCPNPIRKPVQITLEKLSESRPVQTGKVAAALRDRFAGDPAIATVTARTVNRWLTALEQAGLVSRLGNRGWLPSPFSST